MDARMLHGCYKGVKEIVPKPGTKGRTIITRRGCKTSEIHQKNVKTRNVKVNVNVCKCKVTCGPGVTQIHSDSHVFTRIDSVSHVFTWIHTDSHVFTRFHTFHTFHMFSLGFTRIHSVERMEKIGPSVEDLGRHGTDAAPMV
jgi:hypothetical protein